jgi:hypothetical protein
MNPFWAGNPAALGQQTLAGRVIVATSAGNGMARAPRRKSRGAKRAATTARTTRGVRSRAKKARLVKGSRAAKAYMAKIRRKRK